LPGYFFVGLMRHITVLKTGSKYSFTPCKLLFFAYSCLVLHSL